MTTPLYIIPWSQDFLASLLDHLRYTHGDDLSRVLLIFPHTRPEKYLQRLLCTSPKIKRPLIMPECFTISRLFSLLRQQAVRRPAWQAGMLDRVGLLLACVREVAHHASITGGSAVSPFLHDAQAFFPWGVRLAELFEECFGQNRVPENFLYMEGQVTPFAAGLLEHLHSIFSLYTEALQQRGWTTPGRDAFLAAQAVQHTPELVHSAFTEKSIYIAGFHVCSNAEDILFEYLSKEQGATVVIHADPVLADNKAGHWSCAAFSRWAQRRKTSFALLPGIAPATRPVRPALRFVQGFDLHSQLLTLAEYLEADKTTTASPGTTSPGKDVSENVASGLPAAAGQLPGEQEVARVAGEKSADTIHSRMLEASKKDNVYFSAETAVILPDSSLLMPCLHHLPHDDLNISMGYPLRRSPLFQLLDTIFSLQERQRNGEYYWQDLIALCRHPYIKMLCPDPLDPLLELEGMRRQNTGMPPASIRQSMHVFEQCIRALGQRFLNPAELLDAALEELRATGGEDPARDHLLQSVFSITVDGFAAPDSPAALSRALEALVILLLTHGGHLWEHFPIDAECLFRLTQSLIPELAHSSLAHERFERSALIRIARQLAEMERVPFEATPLAGTQVLGMLEARLLSFEHLYIIDATEDILPGSAVSDPLLPDALRPELGLAPRHTREQVAAYNFFRLIHSADRVTLFWQEGNDPGGIQEQKKQKSRFIEELLWRHEQEQGRLFKFSGQDGPLRVLESTVVPFAGQQLHLPVTPAMRRLIQEKLQSPLSASLLDAYLACPLRCYYERIAGLRRPEDVVEGDDPLAVGNLLHAVLYDFFSDFLHRPLPTDAAGLETMQALLYETFSAHLSLDRQCRDLPADSIAMLRIAAQVRLRRLLDNLPATTIIGLEQNLSCTFQSSNGHGYTLTGRIDRLDRRHDNIVILDYKTGSTPVVPQHVWHDESLWQAVRTWTPEKDDGSLLQLVHSQVLSVQLPLYMLLYQNSSASAYRDGTAGEAETLQLSAAFVALGECGQEVPLFSAPPDIDGYALILEERIPALIDFLIRHMTSCSLIFAAPGQNCRWCSCKNMCIVASQ